MYAEQSDFDTFGPWIDVVRSEADIPRLYRDHPIDLSQTRLVLKVPRNIERRDANPSMDLYDHLLIVDDERLTCLSRSADGVTQASIAHHELAVLDDTVELLDGALRVHGTNGAVMHVPYNGSSRDRVRELSDLLRELAPSGSRGDGITSRRDRIAIGDLVPTDNAVIADALQSLSHQGGGRLLGAHASRRLSSLSGGVARLADRLIPVRMHTAVLTATAGELVVFSRRDAVTRSTKPDHSESRRILMLDKLTRVETRPHPRYQEATVVQLGLGAAEFSIVTPTPSETTRIFEELASFLGPH
jgi:hypothetical protein